MYYYLRRFYQQLYSKLKIIFKMKTTKLFWLVSAIAMTQGSEELFLGDSIELVTAPSAGSHNST